MMKQIPNIISIFRIFLVAPILYYLWSSEWQTAFVLVLIAGVSDGLDGYLARTFSWESELGAVLDPVADKILLIGIFVVLGLKGLVPEWLVAMIVFRDLIIVLGFIIYKLMTNEYKQGTLFISKVNTALMIIFVLCHMVNLAVYPVPSYLLTTLMTMIVITTIVSGALYVILWSNYYFIRKAGLENVTKRANKSLKERSNKLTKSLGASVKNPRKTIEEK